MASQRIAPLFRFRDEAEVVRMATDTEFGLGREGSHHGIDDYLVIKSINTAGIL